MKLIVLPYKSGSAGARQIAEALRCLRVNRDDPFRTTEPTTVLNWGRGDLPRWATDRMRWINHPTACMNAIDKMRSWTLMKDAGVPVVQVTTSRREAEGWLRNRETIAVFCRQELQGRDGAGIVVAREVNQIVDARAYSKYVKKVHEYRIHVINGEVVYANKKVQADQRPAGADALVRSGSHGWFFRHLDNLPTNQRLLQASVLAVEALGLDFGGVDVGESQDGNVTVYEVNSAPELGPNTTAAYKRAFQRHYGNYKNNENVPIKSI